MSLKMMLVAALALVMVSCGGSGGGNAALQKKSASTSFKAISALGPSILSSVSLLSNKLRLQDTKSGDLTCESGGGTVTVTSTENSLSIVLKAPDTGCTSGGTTIKTPADGLSMTFTGSGDVNTTFTFTLAINGSATITTGGSTETFSYTNFSIKIEASNTGTAQKPVVKATVTINGSVTSTTDGKQTFDNVKYTEADLN